MLLFRVTAITCTLCSVTKQTENFTTDVTEPLLGGTLEEPLYLMFACGNAPF